jgi:hypothetical protein
MSLHIYRVRSFSSCAISRSRSILTLVQTCGSCCFGFIAVPRRSQICLATSVVRRHNALLDEEFRRTHRLSLPACSASARPRLTPQDVCRGLATLDRLRNGVASIH